MRQPSVPISERPDIELAGDIATPRAKFAAEIHVCDKTIERMNLPTIMIGGVAYIMRKESLDILASSVKRRSQPPKHRRT